MRAEIAAVILYLAAQIFGATDALRHTCVNGTNNPLECVK